jgi:hypothetical protein
VCSARRVLPLYDSVNCVFCNWRVETSSHIFLNCQIAYKVWSKVFGWLQINFITPKNLFDHFVCWSGEVGKKRLRKGYWSAWHATLWVIWKARNDRIFNNCIKETDEIVEEIKRLSWQWSLTRLKIPLCMYYEWIWNPRGCLSR